MNDEQYEALMSAAKGGASGNAYVAGGMGALSFLQAQQERKRKEKESQYQAKVSGMATQSDLLNSALDRYMKAVS